MNYRNFFISAAALALIYSSSSADQVCVDQHNTIQADSRFVDNVDGTITDTETNLRWSKCVLGLSGENCEFGQAISMQWHEVNTYTSAKQKSKDTPTHVWRLPEHRELKTLIAGQCFDPAIDTGVFVNTPADDFWVYRSRHTEESPFGIQISFFGGYQEKGYLGSDYAYVRLILAAK